MKLYFMFRFHLAPHMSLEDFACRAKIGKRAKIYHVEVVHMARWGKAHRGVPPGAIMAPPGPTYHPATSLIRGSSSKANDKPPFESVWSTNEIGSQWIHGPTVIGLEASTDFPTNVLPKFHHVQQLLPPLGAVQGPTIVRRWNQGPGGAPLRPPGAQVTSTALVDAYKYPLPQVSDK
jgi:hypothetical protein